MFETFILEIYLPINTNDWLSNFYSLFVNN